MIYAHVVGGYIVNRILWDGVGDPPVPHGQLLPIQEAAGIPNAPPAPLRGPDAVEMHKFKIAIRREGLRNTFDTYVAGAGANERDFWTNSPVVKRSSRYLESLRTALSLTNVQVRNLLLAAAEEGD